MPPARHGERAGNSLRQTLPRWALERLSPPAAVTAEAVAIAAVPSTTPTSPAIPSWPGAPSVRVISGVVREWPIISRAVKGWTVKCRSVIWATVINGSFVVIVSIDRRTFDDSWPSFAAVAAQIRRLRRLRRKDRHGEHGKCINQISHENAPCRTASKERHHQ